MSSVRVFAQGSRSWLLSIYKYHLRVISCPRRSPISEEDCGAGLPQGVTSAEGELFGLNFAPLTILSQKVP